MDSRTLKRSQLDRLFATSSHKQAGPWITRIREALGMTKEDLAKRMGVIRQRVSKIEQDEAAGKLTIETLQRAAQALGCDFVYTLVPKTSLDETMRTQALKAAEALVDQVHNTMALEDQKTSKKNRNQLVQELATDLIRKNDRTIWRY